MRMFIAPSAWNSGAENIIRNMYIFGTHEQLRGAKKKIISKRKKILSIVGIVGHQWEKVERKAKEKEVNDASSTGVYCTSVAARKLTWYCANLFLLFFIFTSHPCIVGNVKSVNSIETQFSALISSIRSYVRTLVTFVELQYVWMVATTSRNSAREIWFFFCVRQIKAIRLCRHQARAKSNKNPYIRLNERRLTYSDWVDVVTAAETSALGFDLIVCFRTLFAVCFILFARLMNSIEEIEFPVFFFSRTRWLVLSWHMEIESIHIVYPQLIAKLACRNWILCQINIITTIDLNYYYQSWLEMPWFISVPTISIKLNVFSPPCRYSKSSNASQKMPLANRICHSLLQCDHLHPLDFRLYSWIFSTLFNLCSSALCSGPQKTIKYWKARVRWLTCLCSWNDGSVIFATLASLKG